MDDEKNRPDGHRFYVTKASGEQARFSRSKLLSSMQRAGATKDESEAIADAVAEQLYPGISTKKIYQLAYKLLRKGYKNVAGKYHLKRAIMELGPSGFPFEKFVAEVLSHQGFTVKVGQLVQGKCVTHEIDILAEKGNKHFMIECKFHNHSGTVCDVKIPLYIQARFKDIEPGWLTLPGHKDKFHQGWVITNTRFTSDAIQFGHCAGLELIGWNYPDGGSLRSRIDVSGLYPITCLSSLTRSEKQTLLEKNIVLCRELGQKREALAEVGISETRINTVLKEASQMSLGISMSQAISGA